MYSQRGNALFLVLIGVALFAALSYTITRSGRGNGDIQREKRILAAAQLAQHGATLRAGATRMIITGQETRSTIKVNAANWLIPCTTGTDCLFSPDGGGVTPPKLPANLGTPIQYFMQPSDGYGIMNLSMDAPALFWEVDDLPEQVCRMINAGLGITGIPVEVNNSDTTIDAAAGEPAACINYDSSGTAPFYLYYAVLAE